MCQEHCPPRFHLGDLQLELHVETFLPLGRKHTRRAKLMGTGRIQKRVPGPGTDVGTDVGTGVLVPSQKFPELHQPQYST